MATTIVTRTAKGSPLTIAEMDANLTNLKDSADRALFPTVNISVDTTGTKNNCYIFGASCKLTLPASPTIDDEIEFANQSGVATCTVDPNGSKIRGSTEVMTVDSLTAKARLRYTGTSYGWV